MNDNDKGWLKYVLLGGGAGFIIGEIIYHLLNKFVIPDKLTLMKNMITPACAIIGLLVVLYYYNKNKYDNK